MYRAPEQLDLFSGFPITEKVDVWALACVMYTLMFFKPPFNQGEKLASINANIRLPIVHQFSSNMIALLQRMFQKDPR